MSYADSLRGGAARGGFRPGSWTSSRGGAVEVAEPPVKTRNSADQPYDEDRGLTFEQIQKKYADKIFNLNMRFMGNAEDAEEMTLETFFNAWRNWEKFRHDSKVSTWLYQIAHNCCKNRYKQKDRLREREPVSLDDTIMTDGGELSREVADWSAAPEQVLMNQELVDQINKAVDALPEEYRIVLVLAQNEEMSYEQIAQITGLTVPAVKTRLHRARNKMRQRLEPYYRNWSRGDQDK